MQEDPDEVEGFAKSMRVSSRFHPIPGPYDFSWIVDHPIEDKSRPLLVDIGGSDGKVLLSILRNTHNLPPERCVLQDLPHVLDDVSMTRQEEEIKALKKVPIDFFKEETVKGEFSGILTDVKPRLTLSPGALVYHIRRTLHEYADADALNILRLIAKAMTPDSRLLVVDLIITNTPTPLAAAVDLFMCITAGKERTIEMFERLTADAGLRITRVISWEDQRDGSSRVYEGMSE